MRSACWPTSWLTSGLVRLALFVSVEKTEKQFLLAYQLADKWTGDTLSLPATLACYPTKPAFVYSPYASLWSVWEAFRANWGCL